MKMQIKLMKKANLKYQIIMVKKKWKIMAKIKKILLLRKVQILRHKKVVVLVLRLIS